MKPLAGPGLKTLIASMVLGAIVAGAVGFLAGFVGPMIFTPEANMGPMLGIFITGPIGYVSGAAWGLVYWLAGRPRDTPGGTFPVRHAVEIIAVGLVLLTLCLIGAHLLDTLDFNPIQGAKVFIPLWLTGAAINMWVGLSKARRSVAEEASMFLVVFGIPAAVAMFLA